MNHNIVLRVLVACITAAILFSSCKKTDHNGIRYPGEIVELDSKVNASVSGFVTDENNDPVSGATVRCGTYTKATDRYGFFEFKNVDVIKNAATVTVERNGYFPGIRTFIAKESKPAFVRIKLLPKTIAGNIDAATGGTTSLPNGLSVILPANAVVDAATGVPYTGTYAVAMQWIDPTAEDLNEIMPGDLGAIDQNNRMRLLITYGMAAVELTSTAGKKLQLAPGKIAELSFPVPAALSASAPVNIPLWYFDEKIGLWREEGTAVRSGNSYRGQVKHFSFWNCDVPDTFVEFDVTIKDQTGQPIPYAQVRLSKQNDPTVRAIGITNAAGFVNGRILMNEQLKMEVFIGSTCAQPVYSYNFSTGTSNISLGNVTVNDDPSVAHIQGSVTGCNNLPLANGNVYATILGRHYRFSTNQSGAYNFIATTCNGTTNMVLVADDPLTQQQSVVTEHSVVPGNNVIPNLRACGVNSDEYIFYSLDNNQYYITVPPDNMTTNAYGLPETRITGYQAGVAKINILIYSAQLGQASTSVYLPDLPPNWLPQYSGINGTINITEYGPQGGFIKGTGTLTFAEQQSPTNIHTVNISFKKRVL